jgi:restriction endonuclease S subunit
MQFKPYTDMIKSLQDDQLYIISRTSAHVNCIQYSLGDICMFKKGKLLKPCNFIDGKYPIIGSGESSIGMHNMYNMEENTILCAYHGTAGYISRYNTKTWASDCFAIIPKSANIIDNSYLYYLLKSMQNDIYYYRMGYTHIYMCSEELKHIKVIVPPLERQQEIVAILDNHAELIRLLERDIENKKTMAAAIIAEVTAAAANADTA